MLLWDLSPSLSLFPRHYAPITHYNPSKKAYSQIIIFPSLFFIQKTKNDDTIVFFTFIFVKITTQQQTQKQKTKTKKHIVKIIKFNILCLFLIQWASIFFSPDFFCFSSYCCLWQDSKTLQAETKKIKSICWDERFFILGVAYFYKRLRFVMCFFFIIIEIGFFFADFFSFCVFL